MGERRQKEARRCLGDAARLSLWIEGDDDAGGVEEQESRGVHAEKRGCQRAGEGAKVYVHAQGEVSDRSRPEAGDEGRWTQGRRRKQEKQREAREAEARQGKRQEGV